MRLRTLVVLVAVPCSASLGQFRIDYVSTFRHLAADRATPDAARLKRLFDYDWGFTMTEFPEYATFVGYPGQNARWTDRSIAAIRHRREVVRAESTVVASIRRARL